MRLFRTILVLMLVAGAVPAMLAGYLVVSADREALVTDALELAGERVQRLRLEAADWLADVAREVEGTARTSAWSEVDQSARRRAVGALLARRDEVEIVTLYDRAGHKVPGLQALAGGTVAPSEVAEHEARAVPLVERLLFLGKKGERGLRLWSPWHLSPRRQEPMLTLVVPAGDGEIAAVAAEVSLRPIQALIEKTPVGARGLAFVADGMGRYVAHPDRTRVGAQAAEAELVAQLQRSVAALADGGVARVAEFRDTAGRANLGAYAVLPEVGWGVVAAQPRDDAFASVGRMRQTVGLAFGASLLLAVILAAWFARQLTRPVTEFVRGALEIARGRFGHQVNVRGGDEIGELAYTFNFMSRELKSYDDETKRLVRALEAGYLDTIKGLAAAIDAKDPYTRGHSQRVADLSVDIGREMGLEEKTLRALEYGGILHDIGKIGVVESILCKRTRLTEEEMQVMREHPAIGAEIVDGVDFLIEMVPAIRSHHERWDGTGYPDKLRGEEIPIIARIVNAADTWDACTSTRPYSIAMTSEKALEVLTNLRGLQTDPRVHDALVAVVRRRQTSRTVIIQTPVAPPRPAEPAKDDGEGSEKDATAEKLARY